MPSHRRLLLLGAAAALLAGAVAFVVGRGGDEPTALDADGGRSSTTTVGGGDGAPTTPADDGASTTDAVPSSTAAPSTTTAPVTTTSPATPVSTTAPAPAFRSSIEGVTLEQLGSSWRPDLGCPGPEQLRAVNVSHWGIDGAVHQGRLVVAADLAEGLVGVFRDLYDARFPIERMVPIDAYGGDDQASMRANNTSAFNCRYVAGTTRLSQHGLGRAVDVNPLINPYVRGGTVDPPEGAPYADRTRTDPGMIHAGDVVVRAFAARAWRWGGAWTSGQDYQHFSVSGT